jgi:hypothetical protein
MGKNQDLGSGINIPNLQYCVYLIFLYKGLQREIFLGVTSHNKLLGLPVNRISAPPNPQYVGIVHTIYTKLEEMNKMVWGGGDLKGYLLGTYSKLVPVQLNFMYLLKQYYRVSFPLRRGFS